MKIRKVKKRDINQLSFLVLDLYKVQSRLDRRYKIKSDDICLKYIQKNLNEFFKKPKGRSILITEKDNKIIGFIEFGIEKRPFVAPEKGAWIYEIYVGKNCRRKGLATKMIIEAAKNLKKKGIKEIGISYLFKNKESANLWKSFRAEIVSVAGVFNIK